MRFVGEERSDKLAKDWARSSRATGPADLLVVRKQGALDYLEGVLGDVDDEIVHFELDGDPIPVKRPKVEGLIYYHAKGDRSPNRSPWRVDRGGSRWQSLDRAGRPAGT